METFPFSTTIVAIRVFISELTMCTWIHHEVPAGVYMLCFSKRYKCIFSDQLFIEVFSTWKLLYTKYTYTQCVTQNLAKTKKSDKVNLQVFLQSIEVAHYTCTRKWGFELQLKILCNIPKIIQAFFNWWRLRGEPRVYYRLLDDS